jgi:hypothetical protein
VLCEWIFFFSFDDAYINHSQSLLTRLALLTSTTLALPPFWTWAGLTPSLDEVFDEYYIVLNCGLSHEGWQLECLPPNPVATEIDEVRCACLPIHRLTLPPV